MTAAIIILAAAGPIILLQAAWVLSRLTFRWLLRVRQEIARQAFTSAYERDCAAFQEELQREQSLAVQVHLLNEVAALRKHIEAN